MNDSNSSDEIKESTTLASESDTESPQTEVPRKRKVYESTLIPERKRLHVPRLVVVLIFAICVAIASYALSSMKKVRTINTAGEIVFSASKQVGELSQLYITKWDNPSPKRLTSGADMEETPVFTPDGNQIVYLSNKSGKETQIYLVDADGLNSEPITRNTGSKTMPIFMPGTTKKLCYLSNGYIWSTEVGSMESERIFPVANDRNQESSADTTTQNATPVISYAVGRGDDDKNRGAAVLDVNGLKTMVVIPDMNNGQPDKQQHPVSDACSTVWSHDGKMLAVSMLGVKISANKDLSVLTVLDSNGAAIPNGAMVAIPKSTTGPENPVFTPKDDQILFEVWNQPTLSNRQCIGLFAIPSTTRSNPKPLMKGEISNVKFINDKTFAFLVKRKDSGHDLYTINTDAPTPKRISDGVLDVTDYSISPQR